MKNKTIVVMIGSILALIGGCGKGPTIVIETEDVTFNFPTEKTYEEATIHTNGETPSFLLKQYAEKLENLSGEVLTGEYKDSILITKMMIEKPNLEDFMKNNINTAQVSEYSAEENTFTCNKETLTGIFLSFEKEKLAQTIYFLQYFFITNTNGNIISFSTDEESERSQLKNGLKTILCK